MVGVDRIIFESLEYIRNAKNQNYIVAWSPTLVVTNRN